MKLHGSTPVHVFYYAYNLCTARHNNYKDLGTSVRVFVKFHSLEPPSCLLVLSMGHTTCHFTLLRACSPDVPGRSVFVTSYAIGWFCGLSHSCVMASILFSFCAVSFSVIRLSENMSFMGIFDCWSLCMVGHISSMCFCDSSGWPHPLHF